MGKYNEEHLKKLLTLGIPWEEMTEEQKKQQRKEWDKITGDPNELYCTCPRTGCHNNHNCTQCMTLHRTFDGFPDCLRPIDEKVSEGVPMNRRYNMHYKIQGGGKGNDLVDEGDPDGSRERILARGQAEGVDISDILCAWDKIAKDKKNQACRCTHSDCWYHGNCVKCIALHRHFGGFPDCCAYIMDMIEEKNDAYWAEQGGRPEQK